MCGQPSALVGTIQAGNKRANRKSRNVRITRLQVLTLTEERGAYDNDVGRGEIQRMDGINLATQSMNEDQNKVRSTYYKTRMDEIY
jgi:hypothetical protein